MPTPWIRCIGFFSVKPKPKYVHWAKNCLNLHVKTKLVTAWSHTTVYVWFLCQDILYSVQCTRTVRVKKPDIFRCIHSGRDKLELLCGDSDYFHCIDENPSSDVNKFYCLVDRQIENRILFKTTFLISFSSWGTFTLNFTHLVRGVFFMVLWCYCISHFFKLYQSRGDICAK